MRELFEMIDETKEDFDTYIELSMVEIYNENIRDLLNNDFRRVLLVVSSCWKMRRSGSQLTG